MKTVKPARRRFVCVRTGCDAYLHDYGAVIHGDAYSNDQGVLLIRSSSKPEPMKITDIVQYVIYDHDLWFDQHNDKSTIIATEFTSLGYEGRSIESLKK
jgi:hypothetical protein